MSTTELRNLPEPGSKYKLGMKIGGGVGGEVFEAVESQTGKKVAIKVISLDKETEEEIGREYKVLQQFSGNENFPEFYGIYSKKGRDNSEKIWLVMECCERGDAISFMRKLGQENTQVTELYVAYILRETIKAVVALQEKGTSHRDVRGSNVVLTSDGRVKLVDYGISKRVEGEKKLKACVGSPSWLAPEVILSQAEGAEGYDKKADVWAVGITAIELGDGQAPFEDMHPGRALFQIVNNPPPTLRKPSQWSQLYRDFISECLVKDPENRPHIQELLLHPFFELIDKEETFLHDLSALLKQQKDVSLYKPPEVQVRNGYMMTEKKLEKILQEDLAAMARVSEDSVLFQLHERFKKNEFHTFVGDILLILNSNRASDEYGEQYHEKYRFKAKSQNAPHIYSTADSAYRDVFHHEKPQHILFAGETGAGKTANMLHAIDHLLFLGQGLKTSEKVTKALAVIHLMGNAATPHNSDSTRHVLQTQLTFTETGKTSGAVFRVFLLEKERVTMESRKQANFHLLYCFYDALRLEERLEEYHLTGGNFVLLRGEGGASCEENAERFRLFEKNVRSLGFEEEQTSAVKNILASVLLTGEMEFGEDEDGNGVLANPEIVSNVAALLGIDYKKLSWALLNYCFIVSGEAIMRRNSKAEAEEARDGLARGLYSRLVDWVVNTINQKISVSRVVYGDRHVISLLDFYGFECYRKNALSQLFVNTINEELQFHYNQQIFAWEKQTAEEEEIPFPDLQFNDNKLVVDLITSKPEGLLCKLDEATRNEDSANFPDNFKAGKGAPVICETAREFSISHYTGKLIYDASEMPEKNKDFLPPEIIDTMRLSKEEVTKQMFSSLLSKSGNLSGVQPKRKGESDVKSAAKGVNTIPSGQYSQSRQMRTAATTFRAACVDLFKGLTVRGSGFHFVRCLRTDLSGKPGAFDPEVIRQQLRALAVVNTVLITQQGYSYSVSHTEFIQRYKFLAFDFDENVEETKENCRLLLLRLKLEGWAMGRTKVFLKYFNREYLSRLYETQIKKIVKVQSMMRAFMTRRKLCAKIRRYQIDADEKKFPTEEKPEPETEDRAARVIQKRFREYAASKSNLTEKEKAFIRPWCKRWRAKSIFQVLLQYRAERLQTLVNFCLQVHLYNQNFLSNVQRTQPGIHLEDTTSEYLEYLPSMTPFIPKLPFTWDSVNPQGDVPRCEPLPERSLEKLQCEVSAILRKKMDETSPAKHFEDKQIQTSLTNKHSESVDENASDMNIPEQEKPSSQFTEPEKIIPETTENPQEKDTNTQMIDTPAKDANTQEMVDTPAKDANRQEMVDTPTKDANTQEMVDTPAEDSNRQEMIDTPAKDANTQEMVDTPAKDANTPEMVDTPTKDANTQEMVDTPSKDTKNLKLLAEKKTEKAHKPREVTFYTLPSTTKPVKSSLESKFTTSINEMEAKFRNKNYDGTNDDPPFNFRALLKKTNPSAPPRRSLLKEFDFQTEIKNFTFQGRKTSPECRNSEPGLIVTELAPGILIYGKVADL